MVRRRAVFGGAIVLVIVIILLISGCLKSEKQQSLKDYNRHVSEIAQEYETQVAKPLFVALTNATSKPALDLEVQVNQLRMEAQKLSNRANGLAVPSEMTGAQRALLMGLGLRVEGLTKIDAQLPAALGGQLKQVAPKIAGAMQTFLASDVLYSQRVAPLIQQELSANGITASTANARFLPNLGWLETNTVVSRMTGQPAESSSSSTAIAPGTHGSALISTAVGSTTLEPEPALNHVSGGSNPTFTVTFENSGSNPETNVKVEVIVTTGGQVRRDSHVVGSTQPGQKANAEITVTGVPRGAAKVEAYVVPVPGETDVENNKGTYLAVLE